MKEEIIADVSVESKHPSHERLIVDLIGPFVVQFMNDRVKVHAPLCVNHHANILTDSNDISLLGLMPPVPEDGFPCPGFVYGFKMGTGPCGTSPACEGFTNNQLLVLEVPQLSIGTTDCHLTFVLPIPDQIWPLVSEQIFIHQNGASIWFQPSYGRNVDSGNQNTVCGKTARGLRFVYFDSGILPPAIEIREYPHSAKEKAELLQESLDECCFEAVGFCPPFFHFTLRFADSSTDLDDNHQDAYNCFQTMRILIPETLKWRVDYDDKFASAALSKEELTPELVDFIMTSHSGSQPVDCHAAVLVVQS